MIIYSINSFPVEENLKLECYDPKGTFYLSYLNTFHTVYRSPDAIN